MPENKVIDQDVINQALIGIVIGGVLIGISAFFGGAAYLHRKVNKKVTIMVHGSPRLVTPEMAYELGIPSKFWDQTRGIWDSATTARNEEYWESRWTGKKPMQVSDSGEWPATNLEGPLADSGEWPVSGQNQEWAEAEVRDWEYGASPHSLAEWSTEAYRLPADDTDLSELRRGRS